MNKEKVLEIYKPINIKDWVKIKTNRSLFSLRLGGFKLEESDNIKLSQEYKKVEFTSEGSTEVVKVFTDEEWLYIILANNIIIVSGWDQMDLLGEMRLGVRIDSISDYDEGFFEEDEDFFEIVMGHDGWSKRVYY